MTSEWAFLEPWYAALHASFSQAFPVYPSSEMQVSFMWEIAHLGPLQHYSLMIHLKEGDPRNVSQLKVIREAMELFAVLSVVNNKAFRDIFPQITLLVARFERRFFPAWILYVIGDPAVQQDTWSRIIEFSDPSPRFLRAIQKLKTKGLDIEADKGNASRSSGVHWTCKFDGTDVCAYLSHDVQADTVNGIQFDLRTLFNAGVPLILLQLGHSPNSGIWQNLQQQVRMEVEISIALPDLTTENSRGLTAGLTQTSKDTLTIMFDNKTKTSEVINAGILMNRAYDWYRVVSADEMCFKCGKESKNVFAAICLTIAAQMQTPISFSLSSVDSESWPWLINAICCGTPTKVTIWDATLTESDLLGVADTLRYNFSHSTSAALELQSRSHYAASQFGFVDILKGTAVWPIERSGAPAFVIPSSIRCRAWFKEDSIVEVVIPGFGRSISTWGWSI